MINRYSDVFLKKFTNSDYLTITRAKLLLASETLFIGILLILHIILLAVDTAAFLRTVTVTPVLFIGMTASLVYLKKGKYSAAANIFLISTTITVMGGILSEAINKPSLTYHTYIYFVFSVLIVCIVFGNLRLLTIVTSLFILTDIAGYLIVKDTVAEPFREGSFLAFNDSLFSLIFSYILGLLTMKIFSRSVELANIEAGKNLKQTDFIKNILKIGSKKLVQSAEEMSDNIEAVTENTQSQAASTEEVSASIEQINAGVDNVVTSAESQNRSLEVLRSTMDELSEIIGTMNRVVGETKNVLENVSANAKSGEKSLHVMNESMANIGKSSVEMTGIIEIINDISDRINLLSLNAAIEAARAGDSGRGFAVVADEISKLADQTATSIKEIDRLIHANEAEIEKGVTNVKGIVDTIASIMKDIDAVSGRVVSISDHMKKQMESNEKVNSNADMVRVKSSEIVHAMNEQKLAIEEISKTISTVTELAQNNTLKIENMADTSKDLVHMIEGFSKEIEDYKDE